MALRIIEEERRVLGTSPTAQLPIPGTSGYAARIAQQSPLPTAMKPVGILGAGQHTRLHGCIITEALNFYEQVRVGCTRH